MNDHNPEDRPIDRRAQSLRSLNQDPGFAAARDERARRRFTEDNERLQFLANIAKRGVVVPDHLEQRWKELKALRIPNRECAKLLNLDWLGDTEDADAIEHGRERLGTIIEETIALVVDSPRIDPDLAFEVIERLQRSQRILSWLDPHLERAASQPNTPTTGA